MKPEDLLPPPPPRKGEVIFGADRASWPANARVGHMPSLGDRDPPYSEGYRMAARQLAEGVCKEGERGCYQDYLVYPIVFLYRHNVELVLKRLLVMIADLADEDLDHKSSKDLEKHCLDQLWANVKRFLEKDEIRAGCSLTLEAQDREGIDSYLQQLSVVDPDSQAFRYPRNKRGERLLPEALKSINIAVFSDHMERLCSFLDNLDSYLDSLLEIGSDMRAEYWNDMHGNCSDGC